MKKIAAILFLLAAPAMAQTLPDKPQPTVHVKLINRFGKPETLRLPVEHRTVDRSFIVASVISQGLTFADVANTRYCLRLQACNEKNPVFGGAHPNAGVQWGISELAYGFTTYMARRQKRQNDAERAFGARITASNHWYIWPAMNTAVHTFGLVFTLAETHR
jgi:hypothetical protein